VAAAPSDLAARVRLVEATGEAAPDALDGRRFDAVLCHGVLMYLDDPGPLVDALCRLVLPGGLVSIVAKNVESLAVRPALAGDWAGALAAFDGDRQVNGLGLDTRADHVDDLSARLVAGGVAPLGWFGVRLFTDGWTPEHPRPDPDGEGRVLQVELEASRRDPYRRLSRLFHLLGRRPD
jgi:SAM-dependent methyltransferase